MSAIWKDLEVSANNQKQESKSNFHLDEKRLKAEIKSAFAKARAEGLDRSEIMSKNSSERDEYIRAQLEAFNSELVKWCIINQVIEATETSKGHYHITDQGYLDEVAVGAIGLVGAGVGAGVISTGVGLTTTTLIPGVSGIVTVAAKGAATTAISAIGVATVAAPIVLGVGAIAYMRGKKKDKAYQQSNEVFNAQLDNLEELYLRTIDKTINKRLK